MSLLFLDLIKLKLFDVHREGEGESVVCDSSVSRFFFGKNVTQ